MSYGKAKMPETNTTVTRTKKGKLKWITPSKAALRRRKIVVCGACWRSITWEA
jgi:hypothetical protein